MKNLCFILLATLLSVTLTMSTKVMAENEFPEGAVRAVFSVAEGKQVCFSRGNLQYQASTKTWRFAENQYDFVGSSNTNISSNYSGWIDLFGWATSGSFYSVTASVTNLGSYFQGNSDIAYTDYDWGQYNAISNGGNQAGLWRTMTRMEWFYLLCKRPNAQNLLALGTVKGKAGIIILPDNWESGEISLNMITSKGMKLNQYDIYYDGQCSQSHVNDNILSEEQWTQLENMGAVFVPAAGYRVGTFQYDKGNRWAYYWTSSGGKSTAEDDENTDKSFAGVLRMFWDLNQMVLTTFGEANRFLGYSVRLVADVKSDKMDAPTESPSEGALKGHFSIAVDKKARFAKGNLQYQASTNVWRFAEHQWDAIANTNMSISETYTGWIDHFGWGANGYSLCPAWLSVTLSNRYGDSNRDITYTKYDWGQYNVVTNGGNEKNLWRTITTEELAYLLCYRENAKQLVGYGSVNGMNGLILLPDDWQKPSSQNFKPCNLELKGNYYYSSSSYNYYADNSYTEDQWFEMEAAGAVFLPAGGYRMANVQFGSYNSNGYYWTGSVATSLNSYNASMLMFFTASQSLINPHYQMPRRMGACVRLITDVDEGTDGIIVPSEKQKSGNGFYYNLNGQVISKPTKGIYIYQGKKFSVTQ